jgi:hypothetical protein
MQVAAPLGSICVLDAAPRWSFVGVATGAKSTEPQDARGTPDERRDAPPADAIKQATAVVWPTPCGPGAIALGGEA